MIIPDCCCFYNAVSYLLHFARYEGRHAKTASIEPRSAHLFIWQKFDISTWQNMEHPFTMNSLFDMIPWYGAASE